MLKSRVRYQIFVSSTYTDLMDERQAAVEAILRAGHIPAGMELFAAQNKPQMEVIKEWIEESDIFCLILGARYGSLEPDSGKSYVECEYEHAVGLGKPIFSLVLDEKLIDANVLKLGRKAALEQDNESLLKSFRKQITSTLVRMVTSADSIKVAIFEALGALERAHDIAGWVRATDTQMPAQVAEEVARLSAENARLTKALAAANAARDELIGGRSIKEWLSVLSQFSLEDWDESTGKPKLGAQISFHGALIKYGHAIGAGVSNRVNESAMRSWLFGFASALVPLGLVENKKVPASVFWQRLGLSAVGQRLYVTFVAQQSQGQGFIAETDLEAELQSVVETAMQRRAQTPASDTAERARPARSASRRAATNTKSAKSPKNPRRPS